jgi:hypothetical protein
MLGKSYKKESDSGWSQNEVLPEEDHEDEDEEELDDAWVPKLRETLIEQGYSECRVSCCFSRVGPGPGILTAVQVLFQIAPCQSTIGTGAQRSGGSSKVSLRPIIPY